MDVKNFAPTLLATVFTKFLILYLRKQISWVFPEWYWGEARRNVISDIIHIISKWLFEMKHFSMKDNLDDFYFD